MLFPYGIHLGFEFTDLLIQGINMSPKSRLFLAESLNRSAERGNRAYLLFKHTDMTLKLVHVFRRIIRTVTNSAGKRLKLFRVRSDLFITYSEAQLRSYLKVAGFTHIEVYADRKFEAPAEGEQRIYFKARKGKIR